MKRAVELGEGSLFRQELDTPCSSQAGKLPPNRSSCRKGRKLCSLKLFQLWGVFSPLKHLDHLENMAGLVLCKSLTKLALVSNALLARGSLPARTRANNKLQGKGFSPFEQDLTH